MTLFDYVAYYGDYTFKDKMFNEIDNVIFSVLSYINFEDIVSSDDSLKITIKDAACKFFSKYSDKELKKNFPIVKSAIKLLKIVKDTKRFKDVYVFNYSYVGDDSSQFSAITFMLDFKTYYVSFEGTDHLVSGWEEDSKMAYKFPVNCQVLAKKYLDKHFTMKNVKLIVGGHSKGGNLALVASMYCNYFVNRKIIKIYSNDGQGLRRAQINSKFYEKVKDRFIHIIPNYSIVGLLLRHSDNYIVVKSSRKGIFSHNACTWQVDYDKFFKCELSRFSIVFEEGFSSWLDKYDDEKRRVFVKSVFKVLRDNNINDFTQIKIKKDFVIGIIKSSKEINPLVKEMLLDLIKILNKTNKEYYLF